MFKPSENRRNTNAIRKSKYKSTKHVPLASSRKITKKEPLAKQVNRGRPKKKDLPRYTIPLQKLFENPSLVQTLDLFPEIPALLLREIAKAQSREGQRRTLELWMKSTPTTSFVKEEEKDSIENMSSRQKFIKFMKVVVGRTKDSLGVQSDVAELMDQINNLFCQEYVKNEANLKERIWRSLTQNPLYYRAKVSKYFPPNSDLFSKIIDVFCRWQNLFCEMFDGEGREMENRKENY